MKTTIIDTSLIIADAIIEAIEYETQDATLKEQTLNIDGNYFEFDVEITNVEYDRDYDENPDGSHPVEWDELYDFDFNIVEDSAKLRDTNNNPSMLRNFIFTYDPDQVKKIVQNAI